MKRKNVHIRIAGNAKRIKDGGKEGWRCFVSDTPVTIPSLNDEIPLEDWYLAGTSFPGRNFKAGKFRRSGSEVTAPAIVAWIDMYGNIEIADGVAHIELLAPPEI